MRRFTILCAAILSSVAPAWAQDNGARSQAGGASSAFASAIYQGWRASKALNAQVRSTEDEELGSLRNLIVGNDGQIESLLIEGGGSTDLPEFIFRVPWQVVDTSRLPADVTIRITDARQPRYGVFPGQEGAPIEADEFRVSEVIGDYARLQPGYAFGYVSDVVFSREGKALAVLVSRDWIAGGGTFAFPFTEVGAWDPHLSYYGLPYVTVDNAAAAALRVDLKKFQDSEARSPGSG